MYMKETGNESEENKPEKENNKLMTKNLVWFGFRAYQPL